METFNNWSEVFSASMHKLWIDFVAALPKLVIGLGLVVVGWLLARLVRWLVAKFLRVAGLDEGLERLGVTGQLEKLNIKAKPSRLFAKLLYYTVILVFFVGATEVFGWTGVSEKIAGFLGFIPQLIAGLVIFAAGLYIASKIRDLIRGAGVSFGLGSARLLSNIAFFILLIIITLTSLEQIGVNIDLIKANIFILIGGVVLAFGIGYGLGSKDMVGNMLASFYARKKFQAGQRVRVDGMEGVLEGIDSTSVSIRLADGVVSMPASRFAEKDVLVLD